MLYTDSAFVEDMMDLTPDTDAFKYAQPTSLGQGATQISLKLVYDMCQTVQNSCDQTMGDYKTLTKLEVIVQLDSFNLI